MKRAPTTAMICLYLGLLLVACGPPTMPTEAPTGVVTVLSPASAEAVILPTATLVPPTPTLTPTPAEPTATQITIDGQPDDWAGRPVLLEDPAGDAEGGLLDFTTGYGFANQDAVYLLVEVADPTAPVTEFNVWFKADSKALRFQWRVDWGEAFVSEEMADGSYTPVGAATCSHVAFGPALEIRVDLRDLESPEELLLESVTADVEESPGGPWRNADVWEPMTVPPLVNEVDPALPSREKAPAVPQVCAEVVPPVPFGSLPPAPLEFAEPGYAAEWFVAPGVFNMPQEVLITPQGDLLVQGVRNFALFRVADDGTVTPVAEHVPGYLGDVDARGNVYLHSGPQGTISRISMDGAKTIVVESPELQSVCICPLTVGPDGNLYVLISRCSDTADLYQVTPEGRLTHLAEIPQLDALRTAPDGRLLAACGHDVYELSLDDYSLTLLARVPGPGTVSVSGLAVDDNGNIYVSTINHGGQVYRVDPSSQTTLLAEIPTEGLTGIEWMPGTGEVVGGQWIQGSLVAVGPDGAVREIVSGSGLITPMSLAFSPCGELAVPADEAGMMMLVNPTGEVSRLFEYLSYIPPLPFVAFDPDGTLYASEGEPMPHTPKRIIVVPPGETLRTLVEADMPSGLARRADGVLFVAETGAGRIIQVNPDGTTTVLADGLNYPQALTMDTDGNLYVVIGPADFMPDGPSPVPVGGDAIIRITPEGDRTVLAQVDFRTDFAAVAIGPEGDLFATMPDAVVRVSAGGLMSPLASGFTRAIGLAFDVAGNLYVSDSEGNGIVRIGGFPQGTLSGVVTDASNAPIAGARVQVLADGPIVVGQAIMTDDDGRFTLPAAPRAYTVIVAAEGYEATTLEGVEVTADQETVVEIAL